MGLGIILGIAALALLFGGGGSDVHATVVEAGDGTFRFEGVKDGKVIVDDGPFTSAEAAQTAADNWVAAQQSQPVALAGCGSCEKAKAAALGQTLPTMGGGYTSGGPKGRVQLGAVAQALAPYSLARIHGETGIDIRDLHGMWTWAKNLAPTLGINASTPAGLALRKLARRIVGQQPSRINFGGLGDDSWAEVLFWVRMHVRPFTFGRLMELAHQRLHALGYTSLAAGGLYTKTSGARRL